MKPPVLAVKKAFASSSAFIFGLGIMTAKRL